MGLTTGQSIQIKKDQYINNAHRALKSHETLTFFGQVSNHFLGKIYTVTGLKKLVGKFQP